MGQPDTPATQASTSPKEERPHFRPDIEGLRAVAIIAVLLFHIGLPLTSGGFVGVDVFYVISGFLITGLLLREGQESGRVDLIRFYARRMRRLLPAALLVIVVTLVASALIVDPLRLTEIAGDAAASALYVANFRFALEAADYLATEAPSPLLHYWSLGVEEQFYLVWPLILLVATRFIPMRFLGLFVVVLAIASFGLSLYWTEASPSWAFFSPVTRAWQLAVGAILAIGLFRLPVKLPGAAPAIAVVVGLTLIVAAVLLLGEATPYPGVAALVPVLGAALVIAGGLSGPSAPARVLLANPVSRYIGRISYSLYLWHWPLLILIPIALENDDLIVRVALAGVAVVLAAISTELVEQPFRRSEALTKRSRGSVQLGLSASVAVGVAALLVSGSITLPEIPNLPSNLIGPAPEVVELAGVRQDLPRIYDDGCHLDQNADRPNKDCVYGDPQGQKTAYLIGDSKAAQWFPAIDAYARDKGWRLEVHTKSACSVLEVPLWERDLNGPGVYDECLDWRRKLLNRIDREKGEIVFVGSSREYEMLNNDGRIIPTRLAYTFWSDKLLELLERLDGGVERVVLLAETPYLRFDPLNCLSDSRRSDCDPPKQSVIEDEYAELERDASALSGATLLSVNELLCPGSTCPVVIDGTVVYRDLHHITASYMERLIEPVANLLDGKPAFPTAAPTLLPGVEPVGATVAPTLVPMAVSTPTSTEAPIPTLIETSTPTPTADPAATEDGIG